MEARIIEVLLYLVKYYHRYYIGTSMKKRQCTCTSSYFTTIKIFSMILTIGGTFFFFSVGGVFEKHALDTITFQEAKHGWFQGLYVDFNVEASCKHFRCQSLSLQSMV